jgi:hypothetical protein
MSAVGRLIRVLFVTGCVIVGGAAPASAAGGQGASLCSFATGPTGPYNIGANIRSRQPINGDNNPGFAGPGMSPFCRP